MTIARAALVALGTSVIGYGAWLLVQWQSPSQVTEVLGWAIAGVVIHDGVLAPLALTAGWALQRRRPAAGIAIALVVIGTLAVSGFAVLTRSHGGGDNGSLLDRDYPAGFGWAVVVIVCGIALGRCAAILFRSRRRRSADGSSHGRRRRHDSA